MITLPFKITSLPQKTKTTLSHHHTRNTKNCFSKENKYSMAFLRFTPSQKNTKKIISLPISIHPKKLWKYSCHIKNKIRQKSMITLEADSQKWRPRMSQKMRCKTVFK